MELSGKHGIGNVKARLTFSRAQRLLLVLQPGAARKTTAPGASARFPPFSAIFNLLTKKKLQVY